MSKHFSTHRYWSEQGEIWQRQFDWAGSAGAKAKLDEAKANFEKARADQNAKFQGPSEEDELVIQINAWQSIYDRKGHADAKKKLDSLEAEPDQLKGEISRA